MPPRSITWEAAGSWGVLDWAISSAAPAREPLTPRAISTPFSGSLPARLISTEPIIQCLAPRRVLLPLPDRTIHILVKGQVIRSPLQTLILSLEPMPEARRPAPQTHLSAILLAMALQPGPPTRQ